MAVSPLIFLPATPRVNRSRTSAMMRTCAMRDDIDSVLISRGDIAGRVAAMAHRITSDMCRSAAGGTAEPAPTLTIIPILTGSIIFVADLIREMPLPMQIHLISVTSYPGRSTSSRGARIRDELTGLPETLAGADVLIVDDIFDTGRTLKMVRDLVAARSPRSLRTCVLLRKQGTTEVRMPVDYAGFDIPDRFVVGYGLDFNDRYRNLPDIVTLRPGVLDTSPDHATS